MVGMDLTPVYRKLVLSLAANRTITAAALKFGMQMGAARFVAGESLESALAAVQDLNRRGILATLDYLGEGVHTPEVAREMGQAYLDLLDGITRSGVQANVSLKLTQMGLAFDPHLAAEIVQAIVHRAQETGNFVRIDMEDSPYTDATLGLYRSLRERGYENVGTVIQSYLYRSAADVDGLLPLGPRLRIVKGAYREPPDLAYPRKADVDANYRLLVERLLRSGCYTAIATHDERIIDWVKGLGVGRGLFEFQMLYGVRMALQEALAAEGYRVRCYVPYGRMWYPYFARRIAESPRNLVFVVRNLFRG